MHACMHVCMCISKHTSGAWYTSFVDSAQRDAENGAATGKQSACEPCTPAAANSEYSHRVLAGTHIIGYWQVLT